VRECVVKRRELPRAWVVRPFSLCELLDFRLVVVAADPRPKDERAVSLGDLYVVYSSYIYRWLVEKNKRTPPPTSGSWASDRMIHELCNYSRVLISLILDLAIPSEFHWCKQICLVLVNKMILGCGPMNCGAACNGGVLVEPRSNGSSVAGDRLSPGSERYRNGNHR